MLIVEVALPVPVNNLFSYLLDMEDISSNIIGSRAIVPFGRRTLTGVIVSKNEYKEIESKKLKFISEIIDESPVFNPEMLKLTKWLADYYFCSWGEALKAALPIGMSPKTVVKIKLTYNFSGEELRLIKKKAPKRALLIEHLMNHNEPVTVGYLEKQLNTTTIAEQIEALAEMGFIEITSGKTKEAKIKKQNFACISDNVFNDNDLFRKILAVSDVKYPNQSAILSFLYLSRINNVTQYLVADLLKETKTTNSDVLSLKKKGHIEVLEMEVDRSVNKELITLSDRDESKLELTEQQQSALGNIKEALDKNKFDAFLLNGVTGSGKTLVYIQAIIHTLQNNKSALMLVPEISLTPQLIDRFRNVFKDGVVAIHSRMSDGERYDAWRQIYTGNKKIVIGARSAVFAPMINPGLIIVDEEHEPSYKQDSPAPRYNARDIAIMRAKIENATIVLGSATPSIESKYNAETNKYKELKISERADNARMPEIIVVDKVSARKSGNLSGSFSKLLLEEIVDKLKNKEGVILFHNRRGFAPLLECPDCGYIPVCRNCDVSLTFHLPNKQLRCHYCGYTLSAFRACPACGFPEMKEIGTGTQKIEEELPELLAAYGCQPVIQRVDLDTTSKKGSLRKILTAFSEGESDILIGTQMVAKGLDFARVTLVGVVNADLQLFLPDFRATERTYQLLTQVSGRAGRSSDKPGKVIIQTSYPASIALKATVSNSYNILYDNEIVHRADADYPPFSRFISIELSGKDERKVNNNAINFYNLIQDNNAYIKLGPTTPVIGKLRGNYRRIIIIKDLKRFDNSGNIIRKALYNAMNEYNRQFSTSTVKMIIDIDSYHSL